MTRALIFVCTSLLVLAFAAHDVSAKPNIAVLGLEVDADNGNVDQQTTAAAANLTLALRDRARSGGGPYALLPGSDKELIDLKLLNGCTGENTECLTKIAKAISVEFLLYGHLEKTGDKYRVSMAVWNTAGNTKDLNERFEIPITDLAGGPRSPQTLAQARRIYGKMTGEASVGTVVVRVTGADRGTLLVETNGQWQPSGSITSGQAKVQLPEGRYRVAIESEGFQRWESSVTVNSGGESPIAATLQPLPTGVKPSDNGTSNGPSTGAPDHQYSGTVSETSNNHWHNVFLGSAIATGVLAVGFGASWGTLASTGKVENGGAFDYGGNCPKQGGFACSNGKLLRTTTYVTGIGAVAVGGFAVFALYESMRSSSPTASSEHSSRHSRRREVAVTPVLSPTGAGAALQLEW